MFLFNLVGADIDVLCPRELSRVRASCRTRAAAQQHEDV